MCKTTTNDFQFQESIDRTNGVCDVFTVVLGLCSETWHSPERVRRLYVQTSVHNLIRFEPGHYHLIRYVLEISCEGQGGEEAGQKEEAVKKIY